jgi:hypothetical protein
MGSRNCAIKINIGNEDFSSEMPKIYSQKVFLVKKSLSLKIIKLS